MAIAPFRGERIGNLRHRVTWQERVVDDLESPPVDEWQDRGTEPARVEPLKGREREIGWQLQSQAEYKIYTRHRFVPNFTDWRIIWETGMTREGGAPVRYIMTPRSALNQDERGRFLELICTNVGFATAPAPGGGGEEGPELLQNPGGAFTNDDHWTGFNAAQMFGLWGPYLAVENAFGASFARGVTPVETEIGKEYKFEFLKADEGGQANATIGASNEDDGTNPFTESSNVGQGDLGSVTFTATAETTYLTIYNKSASQFDYVLVVWASAKATGN